jgi:hypothetical protein
MLQEDSLHPTVFNVAAVVEVKTVKTETQINIKNTIFLNVMLCGLLEFH